MRFNWKLPTQIIFGAGRFRDTSCYLRGLGKRAFVITSPSFVGTGPRAWALENLRTQLRSLHVDVETFSDVSREPTVTVVTEAASRAREFSPRFVIALGGGSVMDTAKCVALLLKNKGEISDYVYRGPVSTHKPRGIQSIAPLVCIPTVAGTGSEASIYAVVTEQGHSVPTRKLSIFSEHLRPQLSVVDPEFTLSVPFEATVEHAIDTLTHVMETYFSSESETPVLNRLSEAIGTTIFESLAILRENPHDLAARIELSWCSTFALSGIFDARQGGWPIHALAHGLGALTGLPHGRCLAAIFPQILEFNRQTIPQRVTRFEEQVIANNPWGAWPELPKLSASDIDFIATHALEIDGLWKQGEEPYLRNCRKIYREDIGRPLLSPTCG